jgi:hypothetical protein
MSQALALDGWLRREERYLGQRSHLGLRSGLGSQGGRNYCSWMVIVGSKVVKVVSLKRLDEIG